VNRDLHDNMPLALSFESAARINEITKDGAARPLASGEFKAEVTPGDIRVLTWNTP